MYDSPRNAQILQAVSRASERSSAAVHQDLSRGVNSLAMISSVAPLLGIFGTVLGIENSFLGVGAEKSAILAAIFESLSLAFIPTALGLLVGLLAFWCYKYLTAELEAFDLEMKNASVELGNRDSVFCIFSMLT